MQPDLLFSFGIYVMLLLLKKGALCYVAKKTCLGLELLLSGHT